MSVRQMIHVRQLSRVLASASSQDLNLLVVSQAYGNHALAAVSAHCTSKASASSAAGPAGVRSCHQHAGSTPVHASAPCAACFPSPSDFMQPVQDNSGGHRPSYSGYAASDPLCSMQQDNAGAPAPLAGSSAAAAGGVRADSGCGATGGAATSNDAERGAPSRLRSAFGSHASLLDGTDVQMAGEEEELLQYLLEDTQDLLLGTEDAADPLQVPICIGAGDAPTNADTAAQKVAVPPLAVAHAQAAAAAHGVAGSRGDGSTRPDSTPYGEAGSDVYPGVEDASTPHSAAGGSPKLVKRRASHSSESDDEWTPEMPAAEDAPAAGCVKKRRAARRSAAESDRITRRCALR